MLYYSYTILLVLFQFIFSTREHPFEQKRASRNNRSDETVNQCSTVPMLTHAHEQQANVGDEQAAVERAEQRDHFGLTSDVLQRHGIEHQDEEGKAFQIADEGHPMLHVLTSTMGLLEPHEGHSWSSESA